MLAKIAVLLVILAAVWWGFKWLSRPSPGRSGQVGKGGDDSAKIEAEETIECPACRTFVPAKAARRCEREDCPYPV